MLEYLDGYLWRIVILRRIWRMCNLHVFDCLLIFIYAKSFTDFIVVKLYFHRDETLFSLRWNFFPISMELFFHCYEAFIQFLWNIFASTFLVTICGLPVIIFNVFVEVNLCLDAVFQENVCDLFLFRWMKSTLFVANTVVHAFPH